MNNFSLNLFNVKKIGLKIDDIIDNEMNKNEKIDRCKLASLFHLLRFYHWDNSIHNHITLKLKENEYLINPYNYMSYEITASNLIKVNSDNTILNSPSSGFCINKKTIDIHSTVFKSRPEAKCIAHLQIPCLLTICATPAGLLPLCEDALSVGKISYVTPSNLLDDDEIKILISKLGTNNKVLAIKNRGMMFIGNSIEETFYLIYHTIRACSVQLQGFYNDPTSFTLLDDSSRINYKQDLYIPSYNGDISIETLEYEAHMRYLDRMGFCTGYTYNNGENSHFFEPSEEVSEQQSMLVKNYGLSLSETIDQDRRSSDSGVVTSMRQEESKILPESCEFLPGMSFNNHQIPSSESSKELLMKKLFILNDEYQSQTTVTTPKSLVSNTRRLKGYNKNTSLIRRSKSLTSGVEKAIFRKYNEKYINELKQ